MPRPATRHSILHTLLWLLRTILASSATLLAMLAEVAIATQGENQIRLLQPGTMVQREIGGDQTHSYQIDLSSGQYLRVIVNQQEIDLVVTLLGPDGKKVMEVDSPQGAKGPERLSLVAEKTGAYRVHVRPLKSRASAGRYEIKIADLRNAIAPIDFTRVAADKAFAEACELFAAKTDESLRKAVKKYEEAISLFREAGDRWEAAATIKILAAVYEWLSDGRNTFGHYKQALALFQELGDRSSQADIHMKVARLHNRRGDSKSEIAAHLDALRLWREMADKEEEAYTLKDMGWAYYTLGDKREALKILDQSLALMTGAADKGGEGAVLYDIGEILHSLGETEQCLARLNQALDIFTALRLRDGEASTLTYMGRVYFDLGDSFKALDYFNRAYSIRRAENDPAAEAKNLAYIGRVFLDQGEKQKALYHYYRALQLFRDGIDYTGISATLNSLGVIHASLGEGRKALDFYNEALVLARKRGNASVTARILLNSGLVYFELGNNQKATESFQESLQLYEAIDNRIGKADALKNLGQIHYSSRNYQEALNLFDQARKIFRAMRRPRLEARVIAHIGMAYDAAGEASRAGEHYEQALGLARDLGDKSLEADILYRVARMKRGQGRLLEAHSQISGAIDIIETLRAKINVQELRASYFASVHDYYSLDIDLLMLLHKADRSKGYDVEGLQLSERARARVMLEALVEPRANIFRDIDPTLLEHKRRLQQQIHTLATRQLQLQASGGSEAQSAAVSNRISEARTQYQQVEDQIRASIPQYAALMQPRILKLDDIQQMLDRDVLLLEYALGEERSYLWAVTRDSMQSYELPARVKIEEAARRVYDLLTVFNQAKKFETPEERAARLIKANTDYGEASSTLSRMILGPVAPHLKNKRLLIVADGALQYIPFAALVIPADGYGAIGGTGRAQPPAPAPSPGAQVSKTLLLSHEVVMIPSLSTLAILRRETAGRKPAPKTLAILADPVFNVKDQRYIELSAKGATNVQGQTLKPERGLSVQFDINETTIGARLEEIELERLMFTEGEAVALAALLPVAERKLALGFDANRSAAISAELGQYRFLHFATHAILNDTHPELSGIALSLIDKEGNRQEGYLRAIDIFNLKLPAELVVLSACQTGLGKEIRGEGLVGLTRAFMYAGAPRVVVSLWNVNDEATAEIMKRFYAGLLGRQRLRPAAALREAQLSMRKDRRWRAPYYWAGFVLQGEIQ